MEYQKRIQRENNYFSINPRIETTSCGGESNYFQSLFTPQQKEIKIPLINETEDEIPDNNDNSFIIKVIIIIAVNVIAIVGIILIIGHDSR